MSHQVAAPNAGELAYYLVIAYGPNAGGVVAGPYPQETLSEECKSATRAADVPVVGELLTRREARERAL